MRGTELEWWKRLLVFGGFCVVFWAPLLVLVRVSGFSETTALIASSVGVLPLLLLFVPAFRDLLLRVSSLKIGGFEVKLGKAVSKSLASGMAPNVVGGLKDDGRGYFKGAHPEFVEEVVSHYGSVRKKYVVTADIASSVRISMLYFQLRVLDYFFDLRGVLFIDSREKGMRKQILGTLDSSSALSTIEHSFPLTREAFRDLTSHDGTSPNEILDHAWEQYQQRLRMSEYTWSRDGLIDSYGAVFSDRVEVLAIEASRTSLQEILRLVQSSARLVVVFRRRTYFVRTIDHVAREILESLLLDMSTESADEDAKASE